MILPYLLIASFSLLSLLHFYWAFGGRWWLINALPERNDGITKFNPGVGATLVVAIGLLGFGAFYLWITLYALSNITIFTQVGSWMIPCIFLLRAIGDFNYAGFFKKRKQSDFATYDTKFYAPLSLTISLLGFTVASQLL